MSVEKVVTFADVKVGDTVRRELGGRPYRVMERETMGNPSPVVLLKLTPERSGTNDLWWQGTPDAHVLLIQRHVSSDVTDDVLFARAQQAALFFGQRGMGIIPLREALDAYELRRRG